MDGRRLGRIRRRAVAIADERGAAGVEYGILIAAIAGAIVVVAFTVGQKLLNALTSFNNSIP